MLSMPIGTTTAKIDRIPPNYLYSDNIRGANVKDTKKRISTTLMAAVLLADDSKKDYEKLKKGEIPTFKGIPRSLKPHTDLYTNEIEIRTPDGRKEALKKRACEHSTSGNAHRLSDQFRCSLLYDKYLSVIYYRSYSPLMAVWKPWCVIETLA